MAEPKTRPTDADVGEFIAAIPEQRRHDALRIDALMREATGEEPVIWGTSIVGYGGVDVSDSGRGTTSWPVIGFAARKAEFVLYLHAELEPERFDSLGPHRRGVGCLYLKTLDAVDEPTLRSLLDRSVELTRK